MNNIKKIGLLLLVLGVITGFTQAAKEEKPDATIRLSDCFGFAGSTNLKGDYIPKTDPPSVRCIWDFSAIDAGARNVTLSVLKFPPATSS
jgi:hypothetical protein